MNSFKVPFEEMPWEQLRPDVRQKIYCNGSRQIRIVEFDTSNSPENWCESGHIGYVLRGGLRIDFNGQVISFGPGDGLFIPAGAEHQHRAVEIQRGTQLLMIEDIEDCK
jgi:quercetin dioxygenase-like cupin family protein